MKENLKPHVYKLWEHYVDSTEFTVRLRAFCRMCHRVTYQGEVKAGTAGAVAKASLNRALSLGK